MPKWLTMNRVVLIFHGIITVGTIATILVLEVNKSLPHKWQDNVASVGAVIAGLVAGSVAVVKYLDGSQKFDATPLGQQAEATRLGLAPPAMLAVPGLPAEQIVAAGAPDPTPAAPPVA